MNAPLDADAPLPPVEVNAAYSEALVLLADGSRLEFRHTVAERWAKAHEPAGIPTGMSIASGLLAKLQSFRLNAKHLQVRFEGRGEWEWRFRAAPQQDNA